MPDSKTVDNETSDQLQILKIDKPEPKVAATKWKDIIRLWPKPTFLIISNEFCERFAYYGMRTVLNLYVMNTLNFNAKDSRKLTATFMALCYLTPLFGSIVADSFLGKFKTIFLLSIVYVCGLVMLSLSSILKMGNPLHPYSDCAALVLIAIGTGGIKPCVAPFGGDQFETHQARMISIYFAVFYFSINAGSVVSTFLTPMMRSASCFGQNSCYPLAFGVPAILLILAIVVFVSGGFWYKKSPIKSSIFKEVIVIIKHALGNKRRFSRKHPHWIDHYCDDHVCANDNACLLVRQERKKNNLCAKRKTVNDIKRLLRVIVIFLPVPFFWFLYDQQATKWVNQALAMNGRITDEHSVLPDQMQVVNALLILILIPIFQGIVYPLAGKVVKLTPLRKMIAGGVIASMAYVVSGILQLEVNKSLPVLPPQGHSYVSIINASPSASCNITASWDKQKATVAYGKSLQVTYEKNDLLDIESGQQKITLNFANCDYTGQAITVDHKFKDGAITYIHVGKDGYFVGKAETEKPTSGNGEFALKLLATLDPKKMTNGVAFCRHTKTTNAKCDPSSADNFVSYQLGQNLDTIGYKPFSTGGTSYSTVAFKSLLQLRSGIWKAYYLQGNLTTEEDGRQNYGKVNFVAINGVDFKRYEQGGVYIHALNDIGGNNVKQTVFRVVDDNRVSMFWQIPQVFIITAAEILFSITGLEFAFTQSAPSMKAIVQACWLLTVAIGDECIALMEFIPITNDAILYFAFAGFMLIDMGVLMALAIWYYKYDEYSDDEDLKFIEPIKIGLEFAEQQSRLKP